MAHDMQEQRNDIAGIGERWRGWGTIAGALVALAALLLGGGFFYNEIWLSKVLTYTVLPNYDLGGQTFTGLVVENRGRVTLTDVNIILVDLGAPIQAMNMPGAHDPARVASGGVGEKKVQIELLRLSQGGSLPLYLLTAGPVTLEEKKTFFVSSKETVATQSASSGSKDLAFLAAEFSGLTAICLSIALLLVNKSVRDLQNRTKPV